MLLWMCKSAWARYLCAVFLIFLDKNFGLQIVVPAGLEGPLEEGAAFDASLDPGQREMLGE